jgi:nucleotide-binding universal stress UspA family protein
MINLIQKPVMQTILFPTDFSFNAKNALDYGLNLLNTSDINLIVLNAFYMAPSSTDIIGYDQQQDLMELNEITKNNLEEECERIRVKHKLNSCKAVIKYGAVADAVEETIEEYKPDLIIMGTHGASGISKYIIGSNTSSVIENVDLPLLAIPDGLVLKPLTKILFATDFNDSDVDAIDFLSKIAENNEHAEIIIYHVAKSERDETQIFDWFEEMVKEKVKYRNLSFRYNKNRDVENTLSDFVKNFDVSLMAMSTRKRNLVSKLFSKSLTKSMAYHTKVPLLAFHVKEHSDILNIF